MALIDELRASFDAVSGALDSIGVRRTTVQIVTETWSTPVNTVGSTFQSSTKTTVSPNPLVRQVNEDGGSWFGGSFRADASGRLTSRIYQIGPIAQSYFSSSAGGYSNTTLAPALNSPRNKFYVLLSGDDFQSGGERFEIVHFDASDPLTVTFTVERTSQGQ